MLDWAATTPMRARAQTGASPGKTLRVIVPSGNIGTERVARARGTCAE